VSFATDHPYVLTASCPSRMGTTAAVTGFLAARRFYLMEMHQFDDTIGGEGGSRARAARILADRRGRGDGVAHS
jgi:formyltetrahydrofolate hydrolase